ncbi:amino acid adenylation domain-containing protein [Oceanirhabdus seepicola]|uniref:Amino acid adenylation domain-containing protein n=1 Tax=Oceanirhabdus seepicola TaxID=2828781 RepID=A0A9J6NXG2_9CLOT|nr:amino acid adenylation domain-containing protein [Oceanirhabdus seepicola]MCM1988748.1 amino acid adenylation domain-containing protein [Oceanirhabdus seepicola]
MNKTILDFFDKTVSLYPQNIAVGDSDSEITYKALQEKARVIGTTIAEIGFIKNPIAILMKRNINVTAAMLGVLYSGNFYVVLDCDTPFERLAKIMDTLSPAAVIYESEFHEVVNRFEVELYKMDFEKIMKTQINSELLEKVRSQILSTDPAYSIFTSGSTGSPKGALLTHLNVISYIDWFITCFKIDEQTVFGSQTPLYFSMSVTDMFASFFTGSAYQMIPKEFFTFPVKLVEFMNERRINAIYWVPTALGIVTKFDLFKYCKPQYLEKVLFAGEVMPVKYLNYWKKYFPHLLYANLFGPTETTDICAYYIVNREFLETQTLPIGIPCSNCRLFVLDEKAAEVPRGLEGELYASGPFIAKGYYNNKEKTAEAFVQNPLHNDYQEIVYKTGDLVRQNENGEFEYIGRKDFQIKHMGYRIETGEIEAAFGAVEGIELTICIYDSKNDKLILAYEGDEQITSVLKLNSEKSLPEYMRPHDYKAFEIFPKNPNGKIDRKQIKNIILN